MDQISFFLVKLQLSLHQHIATGTDRTDARPFPWTRARSTRDRGRARSPTMDEQVAFLNLMPACLIPTIAKIFQQPSLCFASLTSHKSMESTSPIPTKLSIPLKLSPTYTHQLARAKFASCSSHQRPDHHHHQTRKKARVGRFGRDARVDLRVVSVHWHQVGESEEDKKILGARLVSRPD